MRLRVLATCALLAAALPGCFLKPKKKDGKKNSSAAAGLINREGIVFDRIGDGDVGRFAFKTLRPAICELSLYTKDGVNEPTAQKPKIVPCSNRTEAKADFVERLEGLRTDSLYFVKILAWEPGGSKEAGDVQVVEEPSGATPTPPSPGASPSPPSTVQPDGKYTSIYVARLDVPLKAAEVHRHQLPEATELAAIKTKLNRQTGCVTGAPPKTAPFREAAKDLGIKGLTTRDFAAGTAVPHPFYANERVTFTYRGVNDGLDKWTLIYASGNADKLITARPIAKIANMEMESAEVYAFEAPQLAEAVDPLKLDLTKPLKVSWTTGSSLLEQSYMTVQIGRPDYEKSIYCVFEAKKLTASIDAKLLAGLEEGRHVVLVELASNQFWAKDGWLVTSYDWRSGRIER